MTPFDVAAWAASLACVAFYFVAARRPQRLPWFNAANVVGAAVLVPYDVVRGVLAPALLSLTFGIVGLIGLLDRGIKDQGL